MASTEEKVRIGISLGAAMCGWILVAIALTYKIDYKRFDSIVSSLQHNAS